MLLPRLTRFAGFAVLWGVHMLHQPRYPTGASAPQLVLPSGSTGVPHPAAVMHHPAAGAGASAGIRVLLLCSLGGSGVGVGVARVKQGRDRPWARRVFCRVRVFHLLAKLLQNRA